MKHFIAVLVCAFFVAVSARPETDSERVISAGKNRIKEGHKTCQANPATAIDDAALEQFLRSGGSPPANLGPHLLCISKSAGWQNEDGSVNTAEIDRRISSLYPDAAERKRVLGGCLTPQDTPEKTAQQIFKCYRAHVARLGGSTQHEH